MTGRASSDHIDDVLLSAAIDGERLAAGARQHLGGCAQCQERIADLRGAAAAVAEPVDVSRVGRETSIAAAMAVFDQLNAEPIEERERTIEPVLPPALSLSGGLEGGPDHGQGPHVVRAPDRWAEEIKPLPRIPRNRDASTQLVRRQNQARVAALASVAAAVIVLGGLSLVSLGNRGNTSADVTTAFSATATTAAGEQSAAVPAEAGGGRGDSPSGSDSSATTDSGAITPTLGGEETSSSTARTAPTSAPASVLYFGNLGTVDDGPSLGRAIAAHRAGADVAPSLISCDEVAESNADRAAAAAGTAPAVLEGYGDVVWDAQTATAWSFKLKDSSHRYVVTTPGCQVLDQGRF